MPIGSSLRIRGSTRRKTFPDIRSSGGRYSGLLTGIQTAMQQGQINQQSQMNQAILGLQLRGMKLKERELGKKDRIGVKDLFNAYNKERLETRKAMISKGIYTPEEINSLTTMSFNQWLQGNQDIIPYSDISGLNNPPQSNIVGQGLISNISPTIQRARNIAISNIPLANRGPKIRGFAEGGIVNRPQMAMVGEQGKEYIAPASKLDPATQAKLEAILGKPNTDGGQPDNMPANTPLNAKTGISTEDLIATLDDYAPEDVDQAIEDLIALDQAVNQPGLQLPDTVDYEVFAQAFIQKFGEEAFRRLEARVNEM